MLLSLLKFVLIFLILPSFNSVALYEKIFKKIFSPYNSLIFALAIFPALNAILLLLLYYLNLHAPDSFYLGTIFLLNILPCCFLLLKGKEAFVNFYTEIAIASKKDFLLKYVIALIISFVVVIATYATPYNNDILEYFEIGKVFYKDKSFFYPVLPHYTENLFSSHASHPPFFTLLQSLCFLIQGTTKYHLISNFLHGFYLFLFITIMLTIMQERLMLALACIIFGIFTSNYACYAYFYPSGLDIFRLTYHLFSFFILQRLILNPQSKFLIILLGIFCGLSLFTHSSGLLFLILILPIFLATYPSKNTSLKYRTLLIMSLIAVLIGGGQYLINIYHYGSPISDDVLLWSKYGYHSFMRYERDLYGLKKMLKKFLELFYPSSSSYGYFYPILAALVLVRVKELIYGIKSAFMNFCNLRNISLNWYMPYLLYIIGFYSIVLLSILLEQDLIIKNFRYLLGPYPFVIIMVYALIPQLNIRDIWIFTKQIPELLQSVINSPPKKLLIFLTVLFIICSISIGLFVHKKLEYRIQYLSILKIAEYLTKNLNNDEVVFAFDRSDLYDKVQNAKINFYLNDSTVRYFDIVTAKELYNALKIDKVKYIFTASYRPFIVNKSAFNELLANHAYTEIVVTEQNYTLYRLNYALLNKSDVKKLKTSILIKNQYTYVNLKQNTEYLVDVIQMSKDSDNFYTLLATANGYNYAYFTHNGSTKFRVKTPTLEGDNEAVLTLSITAKDKPLQLKIDIFEAN